MSHETEPRDDSSEFINKLPEVTMAFWIVKVLATTLGETGGDWLSMTMGFGYFASTLVFFSMFGIAVAGQLAVIRFHPFLYWFVIVMTSTAGTTMSDYMDRTLDLGYTKGASILGSLLLGILVLWKLTIGNIEVSRVESRKVELFYWTAILISNTLGTAAGDFLADDSGLGFFGGWLLVTGILLVIAFLAWKTRLSKTLLFWFAFILTRPFGATFGDVLTKSREAGGIALGTAYSSLLILTLLLISIFYFYRHPIKEGV